MSPLLNRLFVCGALLLTANPASAAPPTASVPDIKAAYLVKFGPFVEWKATPAQTSSFLICSFGQNDVSKALDRAAISQTVGNTPVEIHHLASGQSAAGCRILYFTEGGPSEDIPSVLTVTEAGQDQHGIISFVVADNHVRFDIDLQAATKAGLSISAKLLALAHSVKGAP